jgi:hypothetical protein
MTARDFFVKPDGTSANGSSWNWAASDLSATIERAVAGDVIYVAVGTYTGGFIMKEGVTVKGGYTANSNNVFERYEATEINDPAKRSILDGGNSQRVLTQYAPFTRTTTWENFVIQNGSPTVEFNKGSVIYADNGKIVGVLYKYDSGSGEGMMIGTAEPKMQWGGYGVTLTNAAVAIDKESAKNDLSGVDNTEKIADALGENSIDFSQNYAQNGNYAAYWCDTLSIGAYSDWYLPSGGEMQEIFDANIKPILASLGKKVSGLYWTSSQVGDVLAWSYYFDTGYLHPAIKYARHLVSPVHAFEKPAQPDGIYYAGGGVFLSNRGQLENCVVKNNTSPSKGGGVYVGAGGALNNCVVEGNTAPEGKEIYWEPVLSIEKIVPVTNQIRVYPNPVKKNESITVDIAQNLDAETNYLFINSSGMVVSKGILKANENTINAALEQGIYIFVIQSENNNYKTKVIVY